MGSVSSRKAARALTMVTGSLAQPLPLCLKAVARYLPRRGLAPQDSSGTALFLTLSADEKVLGGECRSVLSAPVWPLLRSIPQLRGSVTSGAAGLAG